MPSQIHRLSDSPDHSHYASIKVDRITIKPDRLAPTQAGKRRRCTESPVYSRSSETTCENFLYCYQVHPDGDHESRRGEARSCRRRGRRSAGGNVTSGCGITFWFNVVEQHRHAVNMMATLHLQSDSGDIGQMR
jgi:hypothetical protein